MSNKHERHQAPSQPTAVVAMGGHAFIQAGERGSYEDHDRNARQICSELIVLVERGYRLVITHGNGPQVGELLLRQELTRDQLPSWPLDVLVAQTEGSLGYLMQRAMLNELHTRGINRYVVTMVTQVVVDRADPAFAAPAKPVGPFYPEDQARKAAAQYGWSIAEEAGRGWRRVVPSPLPQRIVQADMVREVLRSGNIAVAGGGGGVPVTIDGHGNYEGVEAVIDKDMTSSVLATNIGADLLVILTAVDSVYLDWGKPTQQRLGAVTMAECERLVNEKVFPPGSMGPKVEAVYGFLERGGQRGLVTSPRALREALDGRSGTHFIGRI
ncbi:MAG: carbamate kinase [Deltaproteobacteria bacterium]|nr:carbamate kinase [Nannocystaceae bacterium]